MSLSRQVGSFLWPPGVKRTPPFGNRAVSQHGVTYRRRVTNTSCPTLSYVPLLGPTPCSCCPLLSHHPSRHPWAAAECRAGEMPPGSLATMPPRQGLRGVQLRSFPGAGREKKVTGPPKPDGLRQEDRRTGEDDGPCGAHPAHWSECSYYSLGSGKRCLTFTRGSVCPTNGDTCPVNTHRKCWMRT